MSEQADSDYVLEAEEALKFAYSQLELYARDLKQTMDGLRASESRLREIVDTVPAILYRLRWPDLELEYISPAINDQIGFQAHELIDNPKSWISQIHEQDRDVYRCTLTNKILQFGNLQHEFRLLSKDRESIFWFDDRARVARLANGEPQSIYGALTNITESKYDKFTLERLNRTLKTISKCNTNVVHAYDEQNLLDDICRNIVTTGSYRLVWIGCAVQDSEKTVEPVSVAGVNDGYLDEIKISWAEGVSGQGPIGTAIRLSQECVVENLDVDPTCVHWKAQTVRRGYASLVALPIRVADRVWGALNIYSEKVDAFSPQIVQLMQELADNIGYGMTVLRTRNERDDFAESLRQNEERLNMIINNNADGLLVLDKKSNIQYMNPAAQRLFSNSINDPFNKPFGFPIEPNKTTNITIKLPDGEDCHAEMRTMATTWHGQESYVISLHDYSERVRYEKERAHHIENLHTSLMETIRAMATALEKRDPYTAGHQHRVAELAVAIGKELHMSEDDLNGLKMGAMIHDLGKIYVPAEILNRPGRLSPVEFELIKSHPQVGYDIVKDIKFPWPVDKMVYQHHERMDGSGYPQGLCKNEIILEARIIGIADVVEAMASHRPYRPGLGIDLAINELQANKGKFYDPDIVQICIDLFQQKKFTFS